jgi:phosphotransacetylase
LGDTITVTVTVAEKTAAHGRVILNCVCKNQDGLSVIEGQAEVLAPREKVKRPRIELPEVRLVDHDRYYNQLLAAVAGLKPLRVAVVHATDPESIKGAFEAMQAGIIEPVWIGPLGKMQAAAALAGIDLTGQILIDAQHSHAAADQAVAMAKSGEVEALMKGSLHTDELMSAVLADVPRYPRPLLITDAAINIAPNLADKRDILQNAIDLAQALGVAMPKVAILSAVETINSKLQSTLDAAALCKMADRGQITGGVLDGPLAFDNAISEQAAAIKDIHSNVAGRADILLVPDLESGNMLAKQLQYLADAQAAGIVLGARVPIILTSRADMAQARMASCAVAQLMVRRREAPPVVSA